MTPMMTLPINPGVSTADFPIAASAAAKLVKAVNSKLIVTAKPGGGFYAPILKWIYSNEPDGSPHNYDSTDAAQKIYTYIRAYHDSVMSHWNSAWGSPHFMGPELYSFNNYYNGTNKVNRLIEQLCGKYNQLGGAANAFSIIPYIQTFTWHYYPFNNEGAQTVGIPAPKDSNLVHFLTGGVPRYGIPGYTSPLKRDIDSLKSWLNGTGIGLAITEANVCTKNDVNPNDAYNVTDDAVTGNGANSFRGAQLYAELMQICKQENVGLNMWSGLEGQPADSFLTNIGFLNSDASRFGGVGGKKPSWHHFQMVAKNFTGNAHKGSYTHNSVSPSPTYAKGLKAFSAVEAGGIQIMIMNQNNSSYPFYISFDSTTTTNSTGKIIFKFKLNNDPAISSNINTLFYPQAADTAYNIDARSTIVLTFDCHGKFLSRLKYTEQMALANQPPA